MLVADFGSVLLRQGDKQGDRSSQPVVADKTREKRKDERPICCAHCRQSITSRRYRLEIDGTHQHTFFNPAGLVFEISCFSEASGCMESGPSSQEFSWFKGFCWRYSLCSGCFSHLGWLFESDSFTFYGFIEKKLIG